MIAESLLMHSLVFSKPPKSLLAGPFLRQLSSSWAHRQDHCTPHCRTVCFFFLRILLVQFPKFCKVFLDWTFLRTFWRYQICWWRYQTKWALPLTCGIFHFLTISWASIDFSSSSLLWSRQFTIYVWYQRQPKYCLCTAFICSTIVICQWYEI